MRNPWRYSCVSALLLLLVVSLFALLIFPSTSRGIKYAFNHKNHDDLQVQMYNGGKSSKGGEDEHNTARRILRGIGSSPPRCASKCGKCRPCKPVHVPVPPGTPVTAEYYPEAWRCKCGNRLYTP